MGKKFLYCGKKKCQHYLVRSVHYFKEITRRILKSFIFSEITTKQIKLFDIIFKLTASDNDYE